MTLRLLAVPALVLALLTPALPASADEASASTTDGNSWYIVDGPSEDTTEDVSDGNSWY